ncbi:MAG: sugar kinase [Rhodobacterales bacterium]|nr:MAG: sugar kinase [Rhodobacterales bacterium]
MAGAAGGVKASVFSGGVNQSGVRDHNERLILSLLHRRGASSGAEVARRIGLSPQTVSNILRKLEADGLLRRGEPVRGRVGKPSIPMELNPDGVLSIGMKIGRRSSDLLLVDFAGQVRQQIHVTHAYPKPEKVFGFLEQGLATLIGSLAPKIRGRVCGLGLGTPFELWQWNGHAGASAAEARDWKDVDFAAEVARFSDLPVFVVNDATAACHAEHLYGRGKNIRDYAYFFIGSFIGGGVVLNGSVFEGNQGNAGALGSMRATGPLGEAQQLIDVASIHLLEKRVTDAGADPAGLWEMPQDWSGLKRYVRPWIGQTAQELAKASLSICSVIDFEAILIDGAFPVGVRDALVKRTRRYLVNQDKRGLIPPAIEAGAVGPNARGIGAASVPVFRQFMLDTNAGLAAV